MSSSMVLKWNHSSQVQVQWSTSVRHFPQMCINRPLKFPSLPRNESVWGTYVTVNKMKFSPHELPRLCGEAMTSATTSMASCRKSVGRYFFANRNKPCPHKVQNREPWASWVTCTNTRWTDRPLCFTEDGQWRARKRKSGSLENDHYKASCRLVSFLTWCYEALSYQVLFEPISIHLQPCPSLLPRGMTVLTNWRCLVSLQPQRLRGRPAATYKVELCLVATFPTAVNMLWTKCPAHIEGGKNWTESMADLTKLQRDKVQPRILSLTITELSKSISLHVNIHMTQKMHMKRNVYYWKRRVT